MKTSTKIASSLVIVLAIAGGGVAVADKTHGAKHERFAKYGVAMVTAKLDLDETQEQALVVLKDQMLIAKQTMAQQMETTKTDVRSLIEADTFDQAKALDMITNKTSTVDSVAPELVVAMAGFLDTLNAEQKAEVLEVLESRKGKRRHWLR